MHLPGANHMFEPDSVEHFSEGIARLIQLTAYVSNTLTSFNTTEQTRGGIAAYDAGIAEVIDRRKLSIKMLHSSSTIKTCMLRYIYDIFRLYRYWNILRRFLIGYSSSCKTHC